MKELNNIWVINQEGVCYFYKKFDPSSPLDEHSFSNFITAMMTFTKDMFSDQFNKLSFGAMDIFMKSFKLFRIVASCKKGTNDKKVLKALDEIGKSFAEKYSSVLKNDFIASMFDDFNNDLDQLLK